MIKIETFENLREQYTDQLSQWASYDQYIQGVSRENPYLSTARHH